eukprot:7302838-Prymnesium_polylepis.1
MKPLPSTIRFAKAVFTTRVRQAGSGAQWTAHVSMPCVARRSAPPAPPPRSTVLGGRVPSMTPRATGEARERSLAPGRCVFLTLKRKSWVSTTAGRVLCWVPDLGLALRVCPGMAPSFQGPIARPPRRPGFLPAPYGGHGPREAG